MGNEAFLAFTTSHLPVAEQNLARYRLQIVEPPRLPLEKKPHADRDGERPDLCRHSSVAQAGRQGRRRPLLSPGPEFEPNLWMWVNPNIVYPPGKLEAQGASKKKEAAGAVPRPRLPCHQEDACYPRALSPSSPEQSPSPKHFSSSPSSWELTEEEEAEDQDDSSCVALPSPHKRAPLQSRRLQQASSQEGRLWPRPPLNYFHLIALALRNSSPRGLNVQQIYSFTRQHFPFFRTAPEGWKNTIRHNLCFRDSFEKVPVSMQVAASARPRSCLWKLTEEGRRRFAEEARALAATQLGSIQQCMSQPDMMPFLFDL
ncbi:forkhead box protein R1 isoform X1 [Oryctolagus cuniculus]|uniref:forkhead box protein R1 isoform X1 n=1 Tax=Oryctolagus cuniculus TaxID=9986 RepID=UPI003879A7A0